MRASEPLAEAEAEAEAEAAATGAWFRTRIAALLADTPEP